jgi:hypothetical protein
LYLTSLENAVPLETKLIRELYSMDWAWAIPPEEVGNAAK